MGADGRHAILFEPVRIGPVTARNRFFQVPHCCGYGHLRPRAHAAMRGMKAEGGWAVVSTEETEIHPSTDLSPFPEQRLWDDHDARALALMTEAVHRHGSLAAIELAHNGHMASNLYSRIPPMGPSARAHGNPGPRQARGMSRADIRDCRRWHRDAVRRAVRAGFDIVYVYAGHDLSLPQHFLLSEHNRRTDEYGGSLENRARLLRELLEDTREEVGDRCAVALRFAVRRLHAKDGFADEAREVVEMLADLPDLWDVNVSDWGHDSASARHEPEEGRQVEHIRFVKRVTDRPVVGVGRFTSPDRMASLVRDGVLDLIGAARPSISDPFLPEKIRAGRAEDIRECIGCNICVASDSLGVPIRCTQNPTMGEEWRRGWHPEKIAPRRSGSRVLVVGAGPAGLECAMQLGKRGYPVTLAEASPELGGRALRESRLKGLASWRRVVDHRVHLVRQMPNVETYRDSPMDAGRLAEFGADAVFLATGARWRRDGVGHSRHEPLAAGDGVRVLTPDDIMDGAALADGPVVVYDDELGYMGGVVAEHVAAIHGRTTLVTSGPTVSPWTANTLEQRRVHADLLAAGVEIRVDETVERIGGGAVGVECVHSSAEREIPCANLVLVTSRESDQSLETGLPGEVRAETIGDALAPGLIADCVHSGHLAARNFEADPEEIEAALYRRETVDLASG